jgi:hypothetical protein
VETHKKLRGLKRRDHKGTFNWIWKRETPDKGEYDYIFEPDDFVSLSPVSKLGSYCNLVLKV